MKKFCLTAHLLYVVLQELFSDTPPVVPVDARRALSFKRSELQETEVNGECEDESLVPGTSRKLLDKRVGRGAYLDVIIDKIGMKDAQSYVNPTIVVSVYGASFLCKNVPRRKV